MNRLVAAVLTLLIFSLPLYTNASLWSTIKGWFGGEDSTYVAPAVPAPEPTPEPEVLEEDVSVTPPAPVYTPPVTPTPPSAGVSFATGVTLQQLTDAINKLRKELEPQIDLAMESPRRNDRADDNTLRIEDGPDGYILTSTGNSIQWTAPDSLGVTLNDSFSTTSADAYIIASSTIPHPGGSILGDVLYFDGSDWVPIATTSLNIASGISTVTTTEIENGTILAEDLSATNSPNDGDYMSYDTTSGGMTFVTPEVADGRECLMLLQKDTNQSIGSGSDVIVTFTSELRDACDAHSTSANTGRYTFPDADGIYECFFNADMTSAWTGCAHLRIDGTYTATELPNSECGSATDWRPSVVSWIDASTATYVEPVVFSSGAVTLDVAKFGCRKIAD